MIPTIETICEDLAAGKILASGDRRSHPEGRSERMTHEELNIFFFNFFLVVIGGFGILVIWIFAP